jgi:peptidoglycan-N-acetylglucosamine deacetylase
MESQIRNDAAQAWRDEAARRVRFREQRRALERERRRRARTRWLVIAAVAFGVLVLAAVASSLGSSGHLKRAAFAHRPHHRARHGPQHAPPAPSPGDLAVDRVLAYTNFVRSGGWQKREIALTFDDGPGPYTPQVLHVLEQYHVPATFFEVGLMERWFHASTARQVRDGFVIGDHTEVHPHMGVLSSDLQQQQLLLQARQIGRYGAPFPRLFRPPYGSFNGTTLSLLHNLHMLMVLWTVDSEDYRAPGTLLIVHRVLSGARPGAIMLLHDAGGIRSETIAALPAIIRGLRARGYQLVTVPQMLQDDPPPPGQRLPRSLGGD